MDLVTAVMYLSFVTTSDISDEQCRSLVMDNLGKDAINLAKEYDVRYVCTPATTKDRMYKISRDNQDRLRREKNKEKGLGKKTFERCGDAFCDTTNLPADYNIKLE